MTKRVIVLISIIFLSVFLELNFPKFFKIFGVVPNFLLILVIFFNVYFRQKNAFIFAVISGIVKDVFSVSRFGTNIISFLICSFVVNRIKSTVYHNDRISELVIVFLVSLLNSFIFYLLNLATIALPFFKSLFFIMLPESIYTAVVGPLVFYGLKRCVLERSV